MDTEPIPFVFSTPVWGAGHIGLFLNVSLPSLLAPGNLPGLAPNAHSRYLIYTPPEYEKDIRTAPSFQRLARLLPVEIRFIREKIVSPHRTMSDCHIDSFRRAEEASAAAVFLPPDCVWSGGSMVRLEALTRSGKSVVHISGIRLDRDGFIPELGNHYSDNRAVLSLKARDLVAMGLHHLHPIARSHFFNEYEGGLMPANLVWTVGDEGLLLRCFHLHPLMVKTQVPSAEFKSTIDDDLALRACPDVTRDYVVTDSDEILAFEMSGLSHVVGTICPKGSIEGIAAWAEYGTNSRHRELIRHPIRIHTGPVTEATWRTKEIESKKIVDAVSKLNRLSWWALLLKYPTIFMGLFYSVALGRQLESRVAPRWVVVLGSTWWMLRKLETTTYQAIFIKNGSLLITHPYWLVRRGVLDAIERRVGRGDRHIVIIAADPRLAWEVARSHPDAIVQSFAADANPDQDLIRRADSASVDLLIAADLPIFGCNSPVAQRIGERRVLIRLSGDQRAAPRNYTDIVYFGGLGTRSCYGIWRWGHVRIGRTPRALLARSSLRVLLTLLAPLIYIGIALIGVEMNVIGLILDSFAKEESPSLRDEEGISREPST